MPPQPSLHRSPHNLEQGGVVLTHPHSAVCAPPRSKLPGLPMAFSQPRLLAGRSTLTSQPPTPPSSRPAYSWSKGRRSSSRSEGLLSRSGQQLLKLCAATHYTADCGLSVPCPSRRAKTMQVRTDGYRIRIASTGSFRSGIHAQAITVSA